MFGQAKTLITEKLRYIYHRGIHLRQRHPRLFLAILLLPLLILLALIFWPRQMTFSYAEPSCFTNPTLMPRLHALEDSESYRLHHQPLATIGDYPVLSGTSCIEAISPPAAATETVRFRPLRLPLLHKPIRINTPNPPALMTAPEELERISVTEPLSLELDQADIVFAYALEIDEKRADCTAADTSLHCPVEEMELEQAQVYDMQLERGINGQSEALLNADVATVTPIEIIESSVEDGQTIYTTPETIRLQTNKPIANTEDIELLRTDGDEELPIPINHEAEADELVIELEDALPREARFRLRINHIHATDNGFLSEPYEIAFETSGGPQLEYNSLDSYGVSRTVNPILRFDYPVSGEQDLSQHIRIEANGDRIPLSFTVNDRYVTLIPQSSLPHCTSFTLSISDELQNRHGASGGSSYEYSSRTICQRVSTIGSSVNGQAISAYSFGDGGETIIFIGGIHGSEASSKYTLDSWVQELEANYERIPSSRTIVVIPNANPDGIAAGTRTNARNVDLNRNFDYQWQSDIATPDGEIEGGGGDAPLSEPESRALANFITSQGPRLVLSYHATGSLVIANDAGNSRTVTNQYASMVGYGSYTSAQASEVFAYDITGSMEDWLRAGPGIPGMLIELTTYSGNEFYRHRSAMWHMTRN